MTKEQQKAFNKAYVRILKTERKTLVPVSTERNEVYVPLSVVTSNMTNFIRFIEKDLKTKKK